MPSPATSASAGIHTPGSIWQKAVEHRATAKQGGGRPDTHVFFTGARNSGKSTLLARFLYPGQADAAKPSPGLEYTFARKASAHDANRKDVAHLWELSGGPALTAQLMQGSHIFLSHRQVTTAVVVIVLDLSDPGSVVASALHELGLVRAKLAATYSLFERRGLQQLPQQLRTRQRNKLLAQQKHPDAALVDCPGISLVLACTKWDALKDRADPEALRVLSHTLRWLAHSNAAHLLYLGGLQPAAAGAAGSEGARLLDNFSRLLNHLAFVGMDRKIPLKQQSSRDHLGPLLVPAGSDSFSAIGLPHTQHHAAAAPGASSSSREPLWDAASIAAGQAQWVEAARVVLAADLPCGSGGVGGVGAGAGGHGSSAVAFSATYHEEEVDGAYSQREAALEAYRQEQQQQQQQQRHISSRRKVAAAAAVPSG